MATLELIPTGRQYLKYPGYALSIDGKIENEEYFYETEDNEYNTENPSKNLLHKLIHLPCHQLPDKMIVWTNWHFEANPFTSDTIIFRRAGAKVKFEFDLFLTAEQHASIKWNYVMLIDFLVKCAVKNGLQKSKYYEKPAFPEEYFGVLVYEANLNGTIEQKINEAKELLIKSATEAVLEMQKLP